MLFLISGVCLLSVVFSFLKGIIKTHNLTFQESESLQAVFSKDSCPNCMVAQAKSVINHKSMRI